jgi:hypothetical protein
MKIRVTMKDPDTLHDSIKEAVADSLKDLGLSTVELRAVAETRHESISTIARKWFEYGEYLTVEIDTEAQTCVVVPRNA